MTLAAGFHAEDNCPHCGGSGIIRAGRRMPGSPLIEDEDQTCDCVEEDTNEEEAEEPEIVPATVAPNFQEILDFVGKLIDPFNHTEVDHRVIVCMDRNDAANIVAKASLVSAPDTVLELPISSCDLTYPSIEVFDEATKGEAKKFARRGDAYLKLSLKNGSAMLFHSEIPKP